MKGEKTGGREKGSENKLTKAARELFIETLEGEVPNIKQALADVLNGTKDENGKVLKAPNPEKYLELYSRYAQYFVPKKVEQKNTHEFPGVIKISVK